MSSQRSGVHRGAPGITNTSEKQKAEFQSVIETSGFLPLGLIRKRPFWLLDFPYFFQSHNAVLSGFFGQVLWWIQVGYTFFVTLPSRW